MADEDKKYEQVLKMLRNSKPILTDSDIVTEKIMGQLQEEKSKTSMPELLFEYLFGWAYIGWVRRSMITVVVVIIVLFGYQQALILRRINDLSGQRIQHGSLIMTNMQDDLTNKILEYRMAEWKLSDGEKSISEKEIDELINSLNKLQVKYKDLFYLIENDPQLKKYVETRMNELKKTKH
jgi:hypothetical protein